MDCLRSRASKPKGDPQIPQSREETPGFGRLILGRISYRTAFSHDVGRLSETIDDDILAQNEIDGRSVAGSSPIFLRRNVGLIVGTLRPFLGKVSGDVFTERSSFSLRLVDLRFDRRWLMENR